MMIKINTWHVTMTKKLICTYDVCNFGKETFSKIFCCSTTAMFVRDLIFAAMSIILYVC